MVKVRLARAGAKKRPYYHIVVTDKENPRDGSFLEQLGTYDPKLPVTDVRLDTLRLEYWKGQGAQLSERVAKVVKAYTKATAAGAAG